MALNNKVINENSYILENRTNAEHVSTVFEFEF